jgi:DNA invertase Pin-like site-specific DNA recombinase
MEKIVQVIKPTQNVLQSETLNMPTAKRRVAAYARVSTEQEEQANSYAAQIDYYTNYIRKRPDWEFVEVYADEGKSGTTTKFRKGFNRMMEDALSGKIDLIVTKSVSRFARNTVDTLVAVRKLKEHNVECYFEKESIFTMDSKGELLITIMSSMAQEESRNISENIRWGQQRSFANGKVAIPFKHFLGYRKGADGLPEIVEEEAKTVRKIYGMFLEGLPSGTIAKKLTEEKLITPGGKLKWTKSTVDSILSNEKYYGAALMQKTYSQDFLNKKRKKNMGELPKYFVEHSHPGIISKAVFEAVQEEIERRKKRKLHVVYVNYLSGKLVCGVCGSVFGAKVWNSTSVHRRTIWSCNKKYVTRYGGARGAQCTSPHVTEAQVREKFLKAINKFLEGKEEVLANCQIAIEAVKDTSKLDADLIEMTEEIAGLEQSISSVNILPGFDEKVWLALVDQAQVQENGDIVFLLKNGERIG